MKTYVGSFLLLLFGSVIMTACDAGDNTMFFKGKDSLLEKAINEDNPTAVEQAIKKGANPNAVGLHGVTPIIVTSGNLKFNAMKALLKEGANPNTYDKNGDNAVTLAATTYRNGDKRYLKYLLDHGGDPNSTLPGKDPLLTRIALEHDLEAIRWLVSKGADVNAISRTEYPLVIKYAGTVDWDTAWTLMDLGANYKFTDPRFNWFEMFYSPTQSPPGSPLFEYKEKVWRKLCENGVEVPPLTTLEMWEYDKKWGGEMSSPPSEMPIISCDHISNKVKGDWGDLKPAVKSAYDALKEKGELK